MHGKGFFVALVLTAAIIVSLLSRRTNREQLSDPIRVPARTSLSLCSANPICEKASDGRKPGFAKGEPTADEKGTRPANGAMAEEGADERAVFSFAAETDRWVRPSPVTESDVREFVRAFDQVPSGCKMQCLHRALNLIPDANVLLLAGLLLDRRQPRQVARTVFDDVANRSDDAKTPILKRIAEDRSHPCSDDAAWIFKVTGENPR